MVVTGPVAKGLSVTSGPLIYLKSDVSGPPTDAEFTTLGVTTVADGIVCFNTLDLIVYVRSGGVYTTRIGNQRQNVPSYVCWFDGTNYRADSMNGGTNYSSTSNMATPLNSVFSNATRGIWVHVRAGDYNMGTATPAVTFGEGGFRLTGEGGAPDYSAATDINSLPGTRFQMGVANQTMFQGTTAKTRNLLGLTMSDFTIDTNGFTGGVGVDLTASNGLSSAGSRIDRVYLNNIGTGRSGTNGSFSTGLILDGCGDMVVSQVTNGLSNGSGGFVVPCTVADISFNTTNGDLRVYDSILYSGVSIVGSWQFLSLLGGTYNQVKLTGVGLPNITRVVDAYIQPTTANVTGDFFNVNGQAADVLELDGCWIRPGSLAAGSKTNYVVLLGGGTLDTLIMRGCRIQRFTGTNTTSITDSAANCGRRRLVAITTRTDGNLASVAPFTVDGNNYLADPGYTTTTPTFPANNTDQQNTNGYSVIASITGTGSGITAYAVKDPAGTSQSYTATVNVGQTFLVPSMSKIQFTYTGSPTWKWYGLNQ